MAKKITFCGRDVTVKTLNVAEVADLLDESKEEAGKIKTVFDLHVLDLLFDDEVPARAVAKATGLTMQELAGPNDPAEVRALLDEVRAQNPFYVGMMERITAVGKSVANKIRPASSPQSAA